MADWSGMMGKSSGYGGGREEFEEEDVWGVENSSSQMTKKYKNSSAAASSSSLTSAWRLQTAPSTIPRANNNFPPCTHEPSEVAQKSAPVNIPDRSKTSGKSAKSGSWVHDDEDDDGYGHHAHDDGEDDGDGDEMVPPHEWVARKLARSQISSFSVCEGIGRTLKGRDLSKVRNAILTKTGFLE